MLKRPADRSGHPPLGVLVTCGGGFQGLTIIKGLRYSGMVRIVMVDNSPDNVSKYFVDKFYAVPRIDDERAFIDAVLDICSREGIALIVPSTNIELPLLARHLEFFRRRGIEIAVSDPDILEIMLNKRALYEFLAKNGFPVLPVLDISDASMTFPVIGKPLASWGGRGILIVRSRDDMEKHVVDELKGQFVWQPYLDDIVEYSIDCAIDSAQRLSALTVRRRVKTIGGFAAISEEVLDAAIDNIAGNFFSFIGTAGGRGIFNIQILKQGKNYYISDVNPRVGTSAVFAYELGINFPLFLCAALNPEVNPVRAEGSPRPERISMVRYLSELWIHHHEGIRGIVFDLDDTLIHQKMWIHGKLSVLWENFRNDLPEKRQFLLRAIQIVEEGNRSHLFDALSEDLMLSDDIKWQLISAYRAIIPRDCPLFPGTAEILGQLRDLGFKLALLTDNPPESQKQKIQACGLDRYFDHITYSRELNCEKPDRSVFLEAAKQLEEPPESLAMVGDNLYKDIMGALDSGFGLAFWLSREGTFFNFDPHLFQEVTGLGQKCIRIDSLRHLIWSLGPDRTPHKV